MVANFSSAKIPARSAGLFCNQTGKGAVESESMDTLWNICCAVLVGITWFRSRWSNERK